MQKEKSLPAITYCPSLKEGNNIENLTNKAKKLYKKLLMVKGKDKALTKDDLNLPIIKLYQEKIY